MDNRTSVDDHTLVYFVRISYDFETKKWYQTNSDESFNFTLEVPIKGLGTIDVNLKNINFDNLLKDWWRQQMVIPVYPIIFDRLYAGIFLVYASP